MKYHYTINDALLYKNLSEEGFFKGYASTFNNIDHHGDIILPGAFQKSLSSSENIKLLWQHDHKEPIGIINNIKEDEKGLLIEGKLLLDLQKAKEAYSLIKNQVINSLSIGYKIDNYYTKGKTRYLTELTLVEISLVTFPANKNAQIHYIKSEEEYLELTDALKRANKALVGGIGVEPMTSTMST